VIAGVWKRTKPARTRRTELAAAKNVADDEVSHGFFGFGAGAARGLGARVFFLPGDERRSGGERKEDEEGGSELHGGWLLLDGDV